jgi:hypothetical protein
MESWMQEVVQPTYAYVGVGLLVSGNTSGLTNRGVDWQRELRANVIVEGLDRKLSLGDGILLNFFLYITTDFH